MKDPELKEFCLEIVLWTHIRRLLHKRIGELAKGVPKRFYSGFRASVLGAEIAGIF